VQANNTASECGAVAEGATSVRGACLSMPCKRCCFDKGPVSKQPLRRLRLRNVLRSSRFAVGFVEYLRQVAESSRFSRLRNIPLRPMRRSVECHCFALGPHRCCEVEMCELDAARRVVGVGRHQMSLVDCVRIRYRIRENMSMSTNRLDSVAHRLRVKKSKCQVVVRQAALIEDRSVHLANAELLSIVRKVRRDARYRLLHADWRWRDRGAPHRCCLLRHKLMPN
jgi:hypothetical protein